MASDTKTSGTFITSGPRIQLSASTPSWTETTVTVSYTLTYLPGSIIDVRAETSPYSVVIDGRSVAGGRFTPTRGGSSKIIATGTTTVNRTEGGRIFACAASATFYGTWAGYQGTVLNVSFGLAIQGYNSAGEDSYTITFNANGGYYAPSPIEKTPGVSIQLPTQIPSRTGYTFLGWATSPYLGSAEYAAGQMFHNDANVTLYAQWQAITYTVSYNANGGSGAPSSQTKPYGSYSFYLSTVTPTRDGYSFKGWSEISNATTATYQPGDRFIGNYNMTLFAVWVLITKNLYISDLSVDRCTSAGVLSETGTYAKITGNYVAANGYKSITFQYRVLGSTGSYTTAGTVSVGSTSGVINYRCGGSFDIEQNYEFRITITDADNNSVVYTSTLATMSYVMDFMEGGKGLTIGSAATEEDFHVKWATYLENEARIEGALTCTAPADFTDMLNLDGIFYLNNDLYLNGGQFLIPQTDYNTRGLFVNHIALQNQIWLQLQQSGGNYTNVLRMNDNNEVEFQWSNSALGGDVRKTLFSGSVYRGNRFTVTGHNKYNVFIITIGSGNGSSTTATRILAVRTIKGNQNSRIMGIGALPDSGNSTMHAQIVYCTGYSSTQWTFNRAASVSFTAGSNSIVFSEQTYISKVEGLI